MKKCLIAISAILLSAGAAQAQMFDNAFENSYVSILGGGSSYPDLSVGATHRSVENGFNVGARAGTWLAMLPNTTLDVDYFYNSSNFTNSGVRLNSSSVMGDLLYHIPLDSPFSLYGGAGLGAVNTNLSGSLHGGSMVLGWQALGGVDYALSPQTSIFAEYRYQNAHDADIGAIRNVGNTSNNLSVGLKYSL